MIVLIWGICRVTRIYKVDSGSQPKKVMIALHILTFLINIVACYITILVEFGKPFSKTYEIAAICTLVAYLVSSLILLYLVNEFVDLYIKKRND